ncbi:patatin-like phospholipase family protein [Bowmanella dokdonensis]|uniref:Patatin-like phospholipase family protein n=1 Tax=Bowmanella dokdonensis TaxID=751969 RepID=A0A939DLY5_9ALTE|nr:patatin-like phospholipase family protein [Bowmanella dokdonensis]MBN7824271.1 patatin-like phospholipase family protein [Bowmanella dokdonensis]
MKHAAVLLFLSLLLGGCAQFHHAKPLAQYDPSQGYRYDQVERINPDNSEDLFIILAFSGGGTRAAALSYGVLEAFRDTTIDWHGQEKRLLDEVDIISSVSGGSFTAAYYGLYRDGVFGPGFTDGFLYKDIEWELTKELLNPLNWFRLASFEYGRSDLAFDYYQRELFGQRSYQAMLELGKPFVMVNGTDMTTGGQFPFVQDQFDLLCSDLLSLPVARAVATSSAFPGLLTPLTYQNHALNPGCAYREPLWVTNAAKSQLLNPQNYQMVDRRRSYYAPASFEPERPYIHLMDGGVADNLGLRSVLFALENNGVSYSILKRFNQEKISKFVVIVVDAATDPTTDLDQSASVPGFVTSILTAATKPLDNYSFDTLSALRLAVREFDREAEPRARCNTVYCADIYLTHVSFNHVADEAQRYYLKNLPTNFNLPARDVDLLIRTGRQLLNQSESFRKLLTDLKPE